MSPEKQMQILTHRGLDPSVQGFPPESTFEAFEAHIRRGFGIEFDVQFAQDGVSVALHDHSLARMTGGADSRPVSSVDSLELLGMRFSGARLGTIAEVISLISEKGTGISALHLKSTWQDKKSIDALIPVLSSADRAKLLVFDVIPEAARVLKATLPDLQIAPSVAHPFDIERYNAAVGGTLIALEQVISLHDVYDWVWLDEWDRLDEGGRDKTFYTADTFKVFRDAGFKIALVTPELHATSPGLLGGEAHQDASSHEKLMKRVKDIIALQPDAVCTDYPDEVRRVAA